MAVASDPLEYPGTNSVLNYIKRILVNERSTGKMRLRDPTSYEHAWTSLENSKSRQTNGSDFLKAFYGNERASEIEAERVIREYESARTTSSSSSGQPRLSKRKRRRLNCVVR